MSVCICLRETREEAKGKRKDRIVRKREKAKRDREMDKQQRKGQKKKAG